MTDYHINVFYSDEDQSYIADIPDFEMCSAHGETPEEALREVLIARDAIIESMKERRQPIPEPRYRPAIYEATRR
ncbi:MAG: type II toxin-antitoxin system HicB family antitoxin [Anaerolineae bacterium]|nr:type II toxin-antitoxin system HicB family antitoxin [Anaerolineae bacterium]